MAYQFNNHCFSEASQVYAAMSADCPSATSDGQALNCVPTATGYNINKFDGVNTTTISVIPALTDCSIDVPQILEFNGLLLALMAAGFVISMMRRPIR